MDRVVLKAPGAILKGAIPVFISWTRHLTRVPRKCKTKFTGVDEMSKQGMKSRAVLVALT